jgi:predicted CXXCH cytochrome family protein
VHTDRQAGPAGEALSAARAKTLAGLVTAAGVDLSNLTAVGMGSRLPKDEGRTREGNEVNDRVEIVVHPASVTVRDSRSLPALKDRERVVISLSYTKGPQVQRLVVSDLLPKGAVYVAGSAFYQGRAREPQVRGDRLVWDIGDRSPSFAEQLTYVVQRGADPLEQDGTVSVVYRSDGRDLTRSFGPSAAPPVPTVKDVCLKCHSTLLAQTFKHGPADAGYCVLCHDPHASTNRAWLRKTSWDLCTTCHTEKASGVHVVAGLAQDFTHPTRLKSDPLRPGRRLACSSCHDPHSAESAFLFINDVKSRSELCRLCHPKK